MTLKTQQVLILIRKRDKKSLAREKIGISSDKQKIGRKKNNVKLETERKIFFHFSVLFG